MLARAVVVVVLACAAACSLVTSLDGYADPPGGGGPSPADGGGSDAAAVPSDGDVATRVDASAPVDGSTVLGCDAPGLIAYWPMDEGTGNVTGECAGRYPATFIGATGWTTRGNNPAVGFSGAGYLALGKQSALQQVGPRTVAGWMKSDSTPGGYTSLIWNYGSNYGYELVLSGDGELYVNVGLGSLGNVSALLWTGIKTFDWRHLAFVYTPGASLEAYVDGVSVAKVMTLDPPNGGPIPDAGPVENDEAFRIGPVFTTPWNGAVDDVRVFGRALSAAEIATLAKN